MLGLHEEPLGRRQKSAGAHAERKVSARSRDASAPGSPLSEAEVAGRGQGRGLIMA